MKNNHYQSLLRFRSYLLFALLTTFVIGIAYLANVKPVSHDSLSSNAIPEVADYVRDFEDHADDSQLLAPALFNQLVQLDWANLHHTATCTPSFTKVCYRARPRSPPALPSNLA